MLLKTILIILVIAFLLLVPDLAIKLLITNSPKIINAEYVFGFIGLATLLNICKSAKMRIILCIFFGIMQLVQTLCISYFGIELAPETLQEFWYYPAEDTREVALALKNAGWQVYTLGFTVICCYFIIGMLLRCGQLLRIPFASILVMILMVGAFARVGLHSKPYLFAPNPIKPSLYNAYNTLALAVFLEPAEQTKYLPYQLTYQSPQADNVIIVLGESIRDDYMSVYGFSPDTTPYLREAVEAKQAFAVPAVSGAVSTSVSLPLFFNTVREPGNMKAVIDRTASLFKMAKQQGYKTILLSAQSSSLLSKMMGPEIDHVITREGIDDKLFNKQRDSILLDLLKEIKLGDKNFIVLHMRSQHYPYHENYTHHPELAIYSNKDLEKANTSMERQKMEYANAMKFSDLFVHQVDEYIRQQFSQQKSYLFFTSDHGQMLGEDGLFLHHHLNFICARVPFIVFAYGDNQFLQKLQHIEKISHYDIALLVAERMGVVINNPNDTDNKRYIQNSLQASDSSAYLQYTIEK